MSYKKAFKRYWKAKQNHAKHKKLRRLEFAHLYSIDKDRIKPNFFYRLAKDSHNNQTAVNLERMNREYQTYGKTSYSGKTILLNSSNIEINGKSKDIRIIEKRLSGSNKIIPSYTDTYKLWLAIKYLESKANKKSNLPI